MGEQWGAHRAKLTAVPGVVEEAAAARHVESATTHRVEGATTRRVEDVTTRRVEGVTTRRAEGETPIGHLVMTAGALEEPTGTAQTGHAVALRVAAVVVAVVGNSRYAHLMAFDYDTF